MYLVAIGVLGTVNDVVGAAAASANLIVFGVGFMPVLADTVCSGTNALVAQVAMRLVAGPAKQIALPSLDILQAFSRKALGAKQADRVKMPLMENGQLGAFQIFLILSSHSLVDYVHIPIWERAQAMPPTTYVLCLHRCLSFCEP